MPGALRSFLDRVKRIGSAPGIGGVKQSVDEYGDQSLVVCEVLPRHRLAQQGDGVQQIPSADLGTDFSRCGGSSEQHAKAGRQSHKND